MQSKPDGWDFASTRMKSDSKDGRDGIRAGLTELEEAGLLIRDRTRLEDGTWDHAYYLLEPDTPSSENTTTVSQAINKEIPKKERISNIGKLKSSKSKTGTGASGLILSTEPV